MSTKKLIQLFLVAVIVVASFAVASPAFAWGGCSGSYRVQWGDTLGAIAMRCGTSVAAIRAANPNLGYWLYAGTVIWLPGASYGNYYGNTYSNYSSNYYGNNYSNNYGNYYGNHYWSQQQPWQNQQRGGYWR